MTHVLDRFISPTALEDHGMVVGLLDIPGAGRRVATWDGLESRHMSAAAARRLAESLMEGEAAVALRPVAEALLDKADAIVDLDVVALDLARLPQDARAGFTGNLPDLSARA
ncbi:hypothetical protein [Phenylobacterium sp.]|uniref:hypothetical protein n=1 Tax=Phenylobacterium sp. TaxID=1871053 RepID=UPI00273780A3|nr:hypothetical protein [Phenylobacterium sp.]MDP3869174.1 hypothetical protein [Phenylobacterium sp.]